MFLWQKNYHNEFNNGTGFQHEQLVVKVRERKSPLLLTSCPLIRKHGWARISKKWIPNKAKCKDEATMFFCFDFEWTFFMSFSFNCDSRISTFHQKKQSQGKDIKFPWRIHIFVVDNDNIWLFRSYNILWVLAWHRFNFFLIWPFVYIKRLGFCVLCLYFHFLSVLFYFIFNDSFSHLNHRTLIG